jgi:hypothetical protein
VNAKTCKYLGRDGRASRAVASAPWLRAWETLKVFIPNGHGAILVQTAPADEYNGMVSKGSILELQHGSQVTELDFYKAWI